MTDSMITVDCCQKIKYLTRLTTDDMVSKFEAFEKHKCSYKLFKEQYAYESFLDIYPFTTQIQLTYSIGGIKNHVKVVGRFIFDSNIPFALPLTIWITVSLMITKKN